jgi:hypothetical protein
MTPVAPGRCFRISSALTPPASFRVDLAGALSSLRARFLPCVRDKVPK